VTWSETVGLKDKTGLRPKKIGLSLSRSSCRSGVVKHGLVTLVVIMILRDTATLQVLFIVSLLCALEHDMRGLMRILLQPQYKQQTERSRYMKVHKNIR